MKRYSASRSTRPPATKADRFGEREIEEIRSSLPPVDSSDVRRIAAVSHYRALLTEHGLEWSKVPEDQCVAVRLALGLSEAEEEAIVAGLTSQLRAAPLAAGASVGGQVHSTSAGVTRAAKTRAMLGSTAPSDAARSRLSRSGSYLSCNSVVPNLIIRALQEVRQRIPAFRRTVAAHGADLSDPVVQRECCIDLFHMLDEAGEGCLTFDALEQFGRKIGPSTVRLLRRCLHPKEKGTSSHTAAAVSLGEFLYGIGLGVPTEGDRTRSDTHRATPNTSQRRDTVNASWHPDDLEMLRKIVNMCAALAPPPPAVKGVTVQALRSLCHPDALDSFRSGEYSLDALLRKVDADGDGVLSLQEMAELLRPAFEASRRPPEEEPILYFKDIKAPW